MQQIKRFVDRIPLSVPLLHSAFSVPSCTVSFLMDSSLWIPFRTGLGVVHRIYYIEYGRLLKWLSSPQKCRFIHRMPLFTICHPIIGPSDALCPTYTRTLKQPRLPLRPVICGSEPWFAGVTCAPRIVTLLSGSVRKASIS